MTLNFRQTLATALCLSCLCGAVVPGSAPAQRRNEPQQVASSVLISWKGKPGIGRYRLQVARDEAFSDIVFDEAVVGRQHLVKGLPPGDYYWRVAPAVGETGSFSKPSPVKITAEAPNANVAEVAGPSSDAGWRTATGEIARPLAAQLRPGRGFDLLGVNADGTVYALDGVRGVALWTARFRTDAKGAAGGDGPPGLLTPFIARARQSEANVVVGFDGGVRALRGETGSEAWRAKLSGTATSGVAADMDGDGTKEVVVITSNPSMLYVIDEDSGRIISQTKLEAVVNGTPAQWASGAQRGVIIAFDGGSMDIRRMDGERVRGVKLDVPITTPPLVVNTSRGELVLVGTEGGLLALKAEDLTPLGRIATENDMPRGTLAATDLDGDGAQEVVMVTRRGRVAVVSTADGRIKWFSEGAVDAAGAAFADVNGDGTLDVLVAAGATFALGFSGRDGSLIWRVEDGRPAPTAAASSTRSLTVAPSVDSTGVLVGGDPARTGLRAVELPKGAVKAPSN